MKSLDNEKKENIFSRFWSLSSQERQMVPRLFSRAERLLFAIFILLFAASGVYAGTTLINSLSDAIPREGGMYREGIIGIPRFINPLLAISDADRDIANLVYTGLLRHNGMGELVPSLAERYEVSEDGMVYTIYMRKDAQWSDGAPVTTDDVVFTLSLAKDPAYRSVVRANWEGVTVEKIDEYTVALLLAKPYAPFLENLTLGILPRHIWRDIVAAEFTLSEKNLRPVGAGPYRVASFKQHATGRITSITLEQNPYYRPHPPYIKTIEIIFFTAAEELQEARQKGSVDAASLPIVSAVETDGNSLIMLSLPRIFGVFFNQNASPVLADDTVRTALHYATDRQRLVADVLHNQGEAVTAPLPHQILGSSLYTEQPAGTFNLATSTALLSNAGWNNTDNDSVREKEIDGEPVRLAFTISTSNAPDLVETARRLQEMWNAAGADIQLDIFEIGDFEQNVLRPRKYEAVLFGEIFGYDPDPFAFWHASQRNDPGLNIALYTNPRADTLLEEARTIINPDERIEIYKNFQHIVMEENPAIFLYSPHYRYQPAARVNGITIEQITVPSDRFGNVHEWYIQTKKQWRGFK